MRAGDAKRVYENELALKKEENKKLNQIKLRDVYQGRGKAKDVLISLTRHKVYKT